MFPQLPVHGRELADLYAAIWRRLTRAALVARARDVGIALMLLTFTAAGMYALFALVPFGYPPRIA